MHASAKISSLSVLIPDGETWDTVKVMRCLNHVSKITVHVLAKTRFAMARFSRYCSSYHYHTSNDDDDWIQVIRNLVQRLQIDIVLPVTEKGVEFLARNKAVISEFAAVPALSDYELIMMAHDKWSFYRFATQNGFQVPASILIGEAGKASVTSLDINSVEYPALLKPTLLDGGFGIVKVENSSSLHRAWESKGIIKGCQYMLQSLVPGVDLCLHLFCKDGKIVAYILQKSLFSPNDYFGPQRAMEFIDDQKLVELGARLVSAMQWDGITCIDFRLDARDHTEKILEVNPRFGQAILGYLVAGINFPLMACLDAIGEEYPNVQQHAVRYAHPIAHGKMLISQFIGRHTPAKVRWREGGLQFTVIDPLPELVDIANKTLRRFL